MYKVITRVSQPHSEDNIKTLVNTWRCPSFIHSFICCFWCKVWSVNNIRLPNTRYKLPIFNRFGDPKNFKMGDCDRCYTTTWVLGGWRHLASHIATTSVHVSGCLSSVGWNPPATLTWYIAVTTDVRLLTHTVVASVWYHESKLQFNCRIFTAWPR